ncbi:unnamed protein product [Pleuronectes platessa]|uniref:Uncharacterized protein n=1 Tax=Pleuronectes platessa TaxID=8262 RepID=A0A9N7U9G0_PLEPL|nr:unnamed protein product [Pleuronectes platessa]
MKTESTEDVCLQISCGILKADTDVLSLVAAPALALAHARSPLLSGAATGALSFVNAHARQQVQHVVPIRCPGRLCVSEPEISVHSLHDPRSLNRSRPVHSTETGTSAPKGLKMNDSGEREEEEDDESETGTSEPLKRRDQVSGVVEFRTRVETEESGASAVSVRLYVCTSVCHTGMFKEDGDSDISGWCNSPLVSLNFCVRVGRNPRSPTAVSSSGQGGDSKPGGDQGATRFQDRGVRTDTTPRGRRVRDQTSN